MTITDFDSMVRDALKAAAIAGFEVPDSPPFTEHWPAGNHEELREGNRGMSAVYMFALGDEVLKVGQAGIASNARFLSQHYSGSARSTLSGSIENDSALMATIKKGGVQQWIYNHVDRFNFMLPSSYGNHVRVFIEAFLILKTNPRYEQHGD